MKKSFIFMLLILLASVLQGITASKDGKISGYVFDKSTGKAIPDANIILSNTQLGAASRDGGFYFIDQVPIGTYDVIARVIGYEIETKRAVVIHPDARIDFFLTPKPVEFDPIIVTATLSDHRQSQVTVASEVLTPTRLREKTGHTVGEVLQTVGSVYFTSYDGITGPQIASIRGSNADQVVVMLDGLRLNTAQGGGVDLNLLPAAALERVEAVRGGHSALIGSDAIGGAIHLISRESLAPKGFLYGINTTLGSFGLQNHNAYGSQKLGRLASFFSYHRIQTDGDFSYKNPYSGLKAIRENNDYQADNIFLKTGMDLSSRNKLQVVLHSARVHKGNAGSVNFIPGSQKIMLTPNARSEMVRQLIALRSENQLAERVRIEAQSYYQSYDYRYKDPDGFAPINDRHDNSALGTGVQVHINMNARLQFISGAEIRQDRLSSTKFRVADRNSQSLYSQAELQFPLVLGGIRTLWRLIPAIRWDHYSDVTAQLTPKFGMLITGTGPSYVGLRGNIGRSYRIPTFDDLYWPDEVWVQGNPDLIPETSQNFDIGWIFSSQSNGLLQAELTYFRNEIKNLIAWGPAATGIWMPLNLRQADINGLETGIRLRLPNDNAYLNVFHTYLDAVDGTPHSLTQGKRLIYRPEHKIDILLGSRIGAFMVNLNYRRVAARFITPDNSKKLPHYQILTANLGYSFKVSGFMVETQIQVLNLTDESIYINDGYPVPGREFRFSAGLQY